MQALTQRLTSTQDQKILLFFITFMTTPLLLILTAGAAIAA